MSLLIKNGKVFVDGNFIEKSVLIGDDRITEITDEVVTVEKVIDVKGCLILPGLIDPHVHFREPGQEEKEDFLSGSRAAAAGGITTVIDMPNNKPAITSKELLDKKREVAKKSIVNYGFHFGSSHDNIHEIKKIKNVASVKIYMDVTTGNMLMDDDSHLRNIFQTNHTISVHAEGDKVQKAIELIKPTKNRLYLCHLSTKAELDMAKRAKIGRVFKEATPHHLFLSSEDVGRLGNFGKMKPELKSKEEQEALWQAISKGKIDSIGSDHAPHSLEDKKSDDCYGVPGVETTLPLLLDVVNKERLKIEDVVRLCCENPAKIFKIKERGFIKEGCYADLVIVDMNKEQKVENGKLFTKCNWSPFDGKVLKGWPIMTIVNGNVVFEDGKIFEDKKGMEIKYEKQFGRGKPSKPDNGGGEDSSEDSRKGHDSDGNNRPEGQEENIGRDEEAV